MQNYCDIIPQENGWVYIINGQQSACYYYTYDLALNGAMAELFKRGLSDDGIVRCQQLNGEMRPLSLEYNRRRG